MPDVDVEVRFIKWPSSCWFKCRRYAAQDQTTTRIILMPPMNQPGCSQKHSEFVRHILRRSHFEDRLKMFVTGKSKTYSRQKLVRPIEQNEISQAFRSCC